MFITWTFLEKSGLGDVGASFFQFFSLILSSFEKLPFLGTFTHF